MKKPLAFSLLELMIALVLLGVLSALAWSILDNFRSAEQRGWKVASRLQSIRSARLWLEEDLLHVCEDIADPTSSLSSPASDIAFQGTATGFSISYSPSIDPLPWLEELVLHSQDSATSDVVTLNRYTRLGLYQVEAKYQLQSNGSLIRTITSQAPLAPRSMTSSIAGDDEPVEPTLTVNDLYRQSDSVDSLSGSANQLDQSKLGPIYRPRFRYHDGNTWKSNWAATSSASLPTAIELSFDLDSSNTTLAETNSAETYPTDELEDLQDPLANVEVPVIELDDDVSEAMLQEPRQIRLVVKLPWVHLEPQSRNASSTDSFQDDTFSTPPNDSMLEEPSE